MSTSAPSLNEKRSAILTIARLAAPRQIVFGVDPLEIIANGRVYACTMTTRTSQTDSKSISIAESSVSASRASHPEADDDALIYGWLSNDGSLSVVTLSVEQHDALTEEGHALFSQTQRESQTFYYLKRALPGTPEMKAYADLADQGKIFFSVALGRM